MFRISWKPACLGVGLMLAAFSSARADDTIRLGGTGAIKDASANLTRLDLRSSDNSETLAVGHRYYGGFGVSYRGGYGGFGYYGGYRSYSYPRFSVGLNFYSPAYYAPSYYYPRYYYAPPVYSYYSAPVYYGYYPIGGTASINDVPAQSLQIRPDGPTQSQQFQPMNPRIDITPSLPLPKSTPSADGTYPYDGGPRSPVPMPRSDVDPSKSQPQRLIPDRAVSLPSNSTTPAKKFVYPAFGEKPKVIETPKEEKSIFVRADRAL